MRSMRSDLNPNLVAAASGLKAGQQLLTVTGLGLCEHPRQPSKGSAVSSAWFKICGLNACQFSAGAFIYYKHLFHHASKRLDTLPSPRVMQNPLPESAYALLKHKQPALGPVLRMNTSSGVAATHRLLPRHQQYLSHILFDYTAPYPQFYLPPGELPRGVALFALVCSPDGRCRRLAPLVSVFAARKLHHGRRGQTAARARRRLLAS